jgi:hypothetical protein
MPALRQARLHPGRHRLVRFVFSPGAGEGATSDLPKLW